MDAEMQGMLVVHHPSRAALREAKRRLTFANPLYIEARRAKRSTRGMSETIEFFDHDTSKNTLTVPRNFEFDCLSNHEITDYFSKVQVAESLRASTFQARDDDQEPAVARMLRYLQKYGDGILVAPTGKGKTVMGVEIALRLGQKTLVLVHAEHLAEAFIRTIKMLAPDAGEVGYIQGDQFSIGDVFTVAMVPTLTRRQFDGEFYTGFGLIIGDEVHRHGAMQWSACVGQFAAAYRLGLTAELVRGDGLEEVVNLNFGQVGHQIRGRNADPRVHMIETNYYLPLDVISMRQCGHCRRYIHVEPDGEVSCSNPKCSKPTRTFNKPATITELCRIPERNERIATVIEKAVKVGRQILVLSDRTEQLRWLKKRLGDVAGLYIGSGKSKAAKAQLEKARTKQVMLATYSKVSEAFDEPRLNTLILASPKARVNQACGRITRVPDPEVHPLVIDFWDREIGPCNSLGFARQRFYRKEGWLPPASRKKND